MKAGRLRTRVDVRERTLTRNSVGEDDESWESIGIRYCDVTPAKAREIFANRLPQAQVTHIVRMRYWSVVTHEHRLKIGDRILHIAGIYNVGERDRELMLECIEEM